MTKVIATIQARMNSGRLPGKIMKKLGDKTVIEILIERLGYSKLIDEICVSTTKSKMDDVFVNFLRLKNIKFFRGSENDVLSRVTNTLKYFKGDIHIECFGDSPLVDHRIIDKYLNFFYKNKFNVVTNSIKTSFPPGSEFLIYKAADLIKLNSIVKKKDKLREHVGYNFSRYKTFRIKSIEASKKFRYPNFFIEIDKKEDLKVLRSICKNLIDKKKHNFSLLKIIDFLKKNKKISILNSKVERRWKELRNEKN